MARTSRTARPVVHYMATRPDGTVPPTNECRAQYARAAGEPVPTVNLADHVGQVVDHPDPGEKWYTDKPFSFFHMYTRPGEILECVEDGWPIRLFVVEPLGETSNWGRSYWLLSQQIRVVAEAARRTYTAWKRRVEHTRALSSWAYCRAEYSRRSAGLATATHLAADAAGQAATDAGASPDAVALIQQRARCLVAGQLTFDRIRTGEYERSIRALLLGAGLDTPAPASV